MGETKNNVEVIPSNKKKISGCIKILPKNKKKSENCSNLRTSSLNINTRKCCNEKRDNSVNNLDNLNNLDNFELQCRDYIDEVLKINEYIKLPNSINNEQDKKKWKKAHCLRNKMKQYDLMTRKRLYQNNFINNKAKFNRERYIILNKIPLYREAFPSIINTSDKIKEDIIRTYLKTHAAYLLSEKKRISNNLSLKKKRNSSYSYRKKQTDKHEVNNSLNYYYNSHPGMYNQTSARYTDKFRKRDLSYNLWKKIIIDNIKKGIINPTTCKYLSRSSVKKYGLGNYNMKKSDMKKYNVNRYSLNNHHLSSHHLNSHHLNRNDIENYNILINGSYQNLKNMQNGGKNSLKAYQKSIANRPTSISNHESHMIRNNYSSNILVHDEKREDAYELNPRRTKMNALSNSNSIRNSSTCDSSNDSKHIHDHNNSKTNSTHNTTVKTHYKYTNNNSNYSNESINGSINESLKRHSECQGKNPCGKSSIENENFIYKKDRFSLLGRIKNNKDIEVKLVLNKV